jgi:hypothetical protein
MRRELLKLHFAKNKGALGINGLVDIRKNWRMSFSNRPKNLIQTLALTELRKVCIW